MNESDSHATAGAILPAVEGTYLEFLNFRITGWSKGQAEITASLLPQHRNTVGMLHGGVIMSLLDLAGALACVHGRARDQVALTLSLSCNFISGVKSDEVIARARETGGGRRVRFALCELVIAGSDKPLATANATFKLSAR